MYILHLLLLSEGIQGCILLPEGFRYEVLLLLRILRMILLLNRLQLLHLLLLLLHSFQEQLLLCSHQLLRMGMKLMLHLHQGCRFLRRLCLLLSSL